MHEPSRRRERRTDWRLGGRAVRRWDRTVWWVLILAVTLSVPGSILLTRLPGDWASVAALLVLWAGLSAPLIYALTRGVPAGLFRLRGRDLIWGLALGAFVRVAQGFIVEVNTMPFPRSPVSGEAPVSAFTAVLTPMFLAPVVEELFFRGVLLVLIYEGLRRYTGALSAGITAALVSAGAFVCLHGVFGALTLRDAIAFLLFGVVASALVLLTGRIWGAVFLHATFNVILLLFAFVGYSLP